MRPPKEMSQIAIRQESTTTLDMAQEMIRGGVAPKGMDNPYTVAAIIHQGRELGMDPFQSLRTIHMVKGRLCIGAQAMAGMVLRSGRAKYLHLVESTPFACEYETQRHEDPQPTRIRWTIEQAQEAGLLSNPTWKSYRAEMLRARCVAAICRERYPDVICGLYSPEEIVEAEAAEALAERIHGERGMRGVPMLMEAHVSPPVTEEEAAKDAAALTRAKAEESDEARMNRLLRQVHAKLGVGIYRQLLASVGITSRPAWPESQRAERIMTLALEYSDLCDRARKEIDVGYVEDMWPDDAMPISAPELERRCSVISRDLLSETESHIDNSPGRATIEE